ncbi:MAG TPA: DUF4190 domain-containing protein [Candidatus Paceibacterota bacterium]|nr:DUF4190 domain-containing protein [Verrucomicrobiota bacterium]HSA09708.1 DUF4190 domain-containing protein [Candidatus Paceibacterota bacterium]
MYKLLGSDQKEYGPVRADQVRAWIAQGRANARSKLQAAGSTKWKPLAEFAEFAEALKSAGAPARSSPPGRAPHRVTAAPKANGMAVMSLVLGCLGILTCGLTSLVGLVLGIIALVRIKKKNGQLGGRGLALAGTIVSAVFLLLAPITAAIFLPAHAKARATANSHHCISNVRQLNLALLMYATDHHDQFPAGTNWCDALIPYLGGMTNAFICPKGAPNQRCHYALNAQLAGRELTDSEARRSQTVLVFECDGGWNVSGGHELLPAKPRHADAYVLGFADGHAEMGQPARIEQLCWEP